MGCGSSSDASVPKIEVKDEKYYKTLKTIQFVNRSPPTWLYQLEVGEKVTTQEETFSLEVLDQGKKKRKWKVKKR